MFFMFFISNLMFLSSMPHCGSDRVRSSGQCHFSFFAARCYASAAYVVMRCLSVCLSVCMCVCVRHVREFCQNE